MKGIRALRFLIAETLLKWGWSVLPDGQERVAFGRLLMEYQYRQLMVGKVRCYTVKLGDREYYQGGDKSNAIMISGIITAVLHDLGESGEVVVMEGTQVPQLIHREIWRAGKRE